MSDLRAETEKAAENFKPDEKYEYQKFFTVESVKHAYLDGATQGPPLLRALEALEKMSKAQAINYEAAFKGMIITATKALLEIEAARGSGEK